MPWNKVLLALLATMIFGMNAVLSKIGLGAFPPLLFNFLRFGMLLPALFFIGRPALSWKMLLAITLTLGVAHLTLGSIGLASGASAGTFVFMQQTGSIFAIVFAYLLCKHKPTYYDLIGIVLGMIGIYWICASKGTQGSPLAIACLIGSAAMWGLGFTLIKKAQAPSLPTTAWMAVIAAPCMGIASGTLEGFDSIMTHVSQATILEWYTILFATWVSMLGAGGIYMYLMRTEPIAKVAPYNMLLPLFGCVFSMLFLGEKISSSLLIGGCWILSGLIIAQFGAKMRSFFNAETLKERDSKI